MRSRRLYDVSSAQATLSWFSRFESTFKDKKTKGRILRARCLRETQSWGNCSCKDKRGTQRSHKSLFFLNAALTPTFNSNDNHFLQGNHMHQITSSKNDSLNKESAICLSCQTEDGDHHTRGQRFDAFKCQAVFVSSPVKPDDMFMLVLSDGLFQTTLVFARPKNHRF